MVSHKTWRSLLVTIFVFWTFFEHHVDAQTLQSQTGEILSPTELNFSSNLLVGAFNVKTFGQSKMSKAQVVEVLTRILVRYDLILIQEIRDIEEKAIHQLLDEVNLASSDDPFDMVLSERLGTTRRYKEQYAYFYRTGLFEVLDQYQYPASALHYERPPFAVRFKALHHEVGEFGVIGIHTKPDHAPQEIDKLVDVFDLVAEMWDLQDIILGGDFNAACRYVTSTEWEGIRLKHDERFLWVIGDDVDTTITTTDCAYDRLVLAGARLQASYVEHSAIAYRFDQDMNLEPELAKDVSDHAPVEMLLK